MNNFQRFLAVAWLVIAFTCGFIFEKESILFKTLLFVAISMPFLLLFALSMLHELGEKVRELENRINGLEK